MERNVRLATGLTLFAYAATHFASHATGLFGLEIMDAVGRNDLMAIWQTWAGRSALFGSLLIHGSLGLWALYRRRHLRIPRSEALQLGLGLLIPLLLIPHASNVRLGAALFGLDGSYYRILYQYWITPPWTGMLRQLTLLFIVWLHGCLGLNFWLRTRRWYQGAWPWLLAAAILLPFLAVLGLVNGGWDTEMTSASTPLFAEQHGPPPAGSYNAAALGVLKLLWWHLQLLYAALVSLVLGLRVIRDVRARRVSALRITYPGGRIVRVPSGFSVLEASRWAGISHASICGGRGRCSTCRVRVVSGLEGQPAPQPTECATLRLVNAAPPVRLACQLRPQHDLSVVPLLPASTASAGMRIAADDGREMLVTALFIDMRNSTGLAASRMPFDALFIVDRYVQCVTGIVQARGGHVTSVAGDGIMSVFGTDGRAEAGADEALWALGDIWTGLDRLSAELAAELDGPLRFGLGVHSGIATVGTFLVSGRPSLHFLGDTGNVAARLEAMTKELACVAIVAVDVFDTAGTVVPPGMAQTELRLRDREALPLRVVLVRGHDDALRLVGAQALG